MSTRIAAALSLLAVTVAPAPAADYACEGLINAGSRFICSGFEPNWAVSFTCTGTAKATFIDAFSSAGIVETPGTVTFSSQDPWTFETSHGIRGTIDGTTCTDESDAQRPFTLRPEAVPGLAGPFFPVCCREE